MSEWRRKDGSSNKAVKGASHLEGNAIAAGERKQRETSGAAI